MQEVSHVSDYFVNKLRGNICVNKLNRLLYYAQMWYLGLYDKPLFKDDFEAWCSGPVIVKEFNRFVSNGTCNISDNVKIRKYTSKVTEHLNEIIEVFGNLSVYKLNKMCCEELPYEKARLGLHFDEIGHNIINKEDMRHACKEILAYDMLEESPWNYTRSINKQ
jgi:uncharacterized phage-associated protein